MYKAKAEGKNGCVTAINEDEYGAKKKLTTDPFGNPKLLVTGQKIGKN